MRRVFPVAALSLLLTLAPASFAQHGGGGHSGGHASGFSGGGFRGGFSAPRSFSGFSGYGSRSFGAAPRMNWTAPRYSFVPRSGAYSGYRPSYSSVRGWDHRYRAPYRGYGYGGYGYGYPYANSWGLLPWDLGYPDFTGYGEDEGSQAQAQPSDQVQQAPPPDYDDAAAPGEGYREDYAPAPYAPRAASPAPLQSEPQLTLVFRDGHTQAIRNYMLTPTDVVVMDDAASGREPRIPLSDLNLPATQQAAQQAGLDFTPPAS
ncbi:MAG TPA: hypothetical protein VMD25_11225 [Acidobacteriaceae bacterium]|nr:hypothetical protein [Acidobacteriaceae bacterium]